MWRMCCVTIAAALLAASCGAEPAQFAEGVKLTAAGEEINVRIGHLVPCAIDWNGDGKKDLVVGQFSGGKIRLYLNEGTDASPKFQKFEYLKAGDSEISLPAG